MRIFNGMMASAIVVTSAGLLSQNSAIAQQTAQANPTSTTGMEEVVVTARRRSENIEKVPVAITAFGAEQLIEREIRSEADLQYSVPGLVVRTTRGETSLNFAIRGQTVDAFTGTSPSVLAYINDVQSNTAGPSSLFDLSSIQVLKGPQGTLFGRNTTGGAVLYETTKPGDAFGGYVTERLGNYALTETIAAVDIPVTDNLFVRIAGDFDNRDGYVHNVHFTDSWLGVTNSQTGRATIVFRPTDKLENTTVYEYNSSDGSTTNNEIYSVYPCGATHNGVPLNTTLACLFSPLLDKTIGFPGAWKAYLAAHPGVNPAGIFGALHEQQRLGPWGIDVANPSVNRSYHWYLDNTTTYEINDDLKLKNIFGVSQSNQLDVSDLLGTAFGIYNAYDPVHGHQGNRSPGKITEASEEFQLLGKAFDNRLDYIIGVYSSYERQDIRQDNSVFDLSPVIPVTPAVQAFETNSVSEAIFAQGSYDLSSATGVDGLKFTTGFRYTWEQQYIHQLGIEFAEGTGQPEESASFSDPSWQVGFDYQITPDLLTYVVQRGSWRSGGFNGFILPAIPTIASAGGNKFLPETTYDLEVGLKYHGLFFGAPGTVNAALYDQWIDDVQRAEYFNHNGRGTSATANIPSAEVAGFELSAEIYPVPWLDFGFDGSYTDARYTDGAISAFGTLSVYGPYADSPRWSGSVHAQVKLPTPDPWGDMSVRAELFGQTGNYFSNLNNTGNPESRIPGYGLLNLRYDWKDMFGSDLSLAAFAKNVLDHPYYSGGIGVALSFGANSVVPGLPQMYGVELTYKFGAAGNGPSEETSAPYTPPPAQAPAPAAPAHSYLVFFDFNRSDLTAQARGIVDQAAANAGPAHVTRLTVTGHTDTVGSDAYNMRLSRRRAESVASQLEKDGISSGEIEIVAKGKRDLLVPTADGVREPQNRRVQIVYDGAQSS